MPLEIRELVIRTTVDRQNNSAAPATSSTDENCASPPASESNEVQASEVLEMIKNRNER